MKKEKEDVIFPILGLMIFLIFFFLLIKYESTLLIFLFLLIGMNLLLIIYVYIYLRKKRDIKILKIRSLFIIPVYPIALYYIYIINIGYNLSKNEILIIQGFVMFLLILSAIYEFVYRRKK
jgi:hypothetical protein